MQLTRTPRAGPPPGDRPQDLAAQLRPGPAHILAEVALFVAAVAVYFGVRGLTEGRPEAAYRNAERVWAMERALSLNHEELLQRLILHSADLSRLANSVYIYGHWPVIAVALSWLLVRHRDVFRRIRDAMFLSGLIGMVVFATFPVAPPRLSVLGLVDTVATQSNAYRVLQPAAFTNQYAAMPSLHVGWDLLVGIALCTAASRLWLRAVGVILPVAMTLAVVTTANHFVLDVIVGALLAAAAWRVVAADSLHRLRAAFTGTVDNLERHPGTGRRDAAAGHG